MSNKKTITRGVRLDSVTDMYIRIIAEFEGRTINNAIQRLLENATIEYCINHDKNTKFRNFLRKRIALYSAAKCLTPEELENYVFYNIDIDDNPEDINKSLADILRDIPKEYTQDNPVEKKN